MKNTKKGFTLVELLVVIAILAILASVAVVGYTAFIDRAKESNAKTEAHQIDAAIEAMLLHNDAVLVAANTWVVPATAGGYEVVTEEPDVDDIVDCSEDFAKLPGQLGYTGTTLTYTSEEIVINVDAGEVVE